MPPTSTSAPATPRRFDAWGALCIAAYVLLGLALIARVPLNSAPDEFAHFEYIQHIATLRSLPLFAGAAPPKYGYEFHQPPLYYILCAPPWAMLGAGVQNYSARLVSLLCGALSVWLVLLSARAMLGADERGERMARRAGMLAALWPLHLAIGASANNDALGGLCCAALFWRLGLLANRAPLVRDGVWIGVLCGLGLLSKNTTITVAVASMLGLWQMSRRAFAAVQFPAQQPAPVVTAARASSTSKTPQGLAVASGKAAGNTAGGPVAAIEPGRVLGAGLVAALAVCGWLLIRNTRLYGDALAYGAFSKAANAIGPGLAIFTQFLGFSTFGYVRNLVVVLFATCWGFFGGPGAVGKGGAIEGFRLSSHGASLPSGWLGLSALLLLAASIWVAIRGLGIVARLLKRLRSQSGSGRDWALLWWSVAVALVVLAWAQFAVAHFAGAQARYLQAAMLPACVLAARAWEDVPSRARATASWVLAGVLIALTVANVLGWRTLV